MSEQVTANTMACSEYQRLLEGSLSAREILNEHRAEIYRSPSVEDAAVDEVLRSQVKYAQAYAFLWNHVNDCLRCQLEQALREENLFVRLSIRNTCFFLAWAWGSGART